MLFSTVVAPETQNYVPLLKAASYLLEHIIKTTVHPYARIDARHCCYRRSIIHHLPPHECVKTTLQQSLEQNSSAAGYQCTAAAAAVLLYMPTLIFFCRFPHISNRPHLHGEVCLCKSSWLQLATADADTVLLDVRSWLA